MKQRIIDDDFISRLEQVALHMQSSMQGYFGGNHRTRTYGQTVEFADFREYALGDDIRRIDWNLYSRFEKYFIRLFVDERQMHIQIFLDCSASMFKIDRDKAEYAMKLAAALGYLSVRNMDKTSIHLLKGDFTDDLSGIIAGKDAFFQTLGRLEEAKFEGDTDIERAILSCPNVGTNDGLTIIITDLLTESNWKKAIDYLVFRKRQVMLVQILSPEEINPIYNGRMRLVDCESTDPLDPRNMRMKITKSDLRAYRRALADMQADAKSFCSSRGVHFITARCDESIERLIFEKLYEIGTIR